MEKPMPISFYVSLKERFPGPTAFVRKLLRGEAGQVFAEWKDEPDKLVY